MTKQIRIFLRRGGTDNSLTVHLTSPALLTIYNRPLLPQRVVFVPLNNAPRAASPPPPSTAAHPRGDVRVCSSMLIIISVSHPPPAQMLSCIYIGN